MNALRALLARSKALLLGKGYVETTPAGLRSMAQAAHKEERYQVEKRQTRYTYAAGPMLYLGQQIVKAMEDAGYPAKIVEHYRSPQRQAELYAKGRTAPGGIVTNAKAYRSAHQYYEAVDIVHPERGWAVSPEYWDVLATCVRIVAERFGVPLNHGHHWKFTDSAHIEMGDWKVFKHDIFQRDGLRPPTPYELWERFKEVLPEVSKRYEKDHHGPPEAVKQYLAGLDADREFS